MINYDYSIGWIKNWADNSNPLDINKGIISFARTCFPDIIYDEIPIVHTDLYRDLLQMYNPCYRFAQERQFQEIVFRGAAKGQPLDRKVLSINGWVSIKNLKVGDQIYSSDGKLTTITHLHPITKMEIYEVETRDGRITQCDEEHLWYVEDIAMKKMVTRPVKELYNCYKYPHIDKRYNKVNYDYRFLLHNPEPVEFEQKNLPINPYLLGLAIGDGHTDKSNGYTRITTGDYSIVEEIIDITNGECGISNVKNKDYLYIVSLKGLSKYFKLLGLNVGAKDKFIPSEYLFSSVEDRLSLLQGLCDTDGYADYRSIKSTFYFSTISKRLADDFKFLVRSLGGTYKHKYSNAKLNGKSFPYYRISAKLPSYMPPFRLGRKLLHVQSNDRLFNSIVRIEKVGIKERRCITISNPSGLYITDDFMVTHNSTISSFILPIYVTLFNGFKIKIADWDRDNNGLNSADGIDVEIREDVIVIVSETGTMAENWITQIRGSIASNKIIKAVFGNLKQHAVKDDEGRWTRSAFTIVKHSLPETWLRGKGLTLVGKGVNMQQRGLNIRGRPTLIIFDDLYSLNNTKTPESRRKVRYIADQEIRNSIDPKRGKTVSMGTVVHEDTIVVDYENSRFWHTIKYPIMDKTLFEEVLHKHCKINRDLGQMDYPETKKCVELESRGYKTFWPTRWTLEMLFAKYAEQIEKHAESAFWQEMFHIVLAEEDKKIRKNMIRWADIELVEKNIGNNYYSFVKVTDQDGTRYAHVNLGIGIDAAMSYKDTADNSAIIMIGMDYFGRVYYIKNRYGKFGISDEMKPDFINTYINKLCTNESQIARIGSADEIFRWVINTHHRPKFIIETNAIGNEIYRQVRTKMSNYGMRYMLLEVLQTTNKEERILDTLQPYYQQRSAYHNNLDNQSQLVYELEYIGKAKQDDNADISATVISQLSKPSSLITWDKPIENKKDGYKSPLWIRKTPANHRDWRVK